MTEDGKPYGPIRFKDIVKERYIITKHTNTSYGDINNMTPLERSYIIEFIKDDLQRQKDLYDKVKAEANQK